MIEIDGSYGEGGGQIIRTSVSLAAITGRAVRVFNVRARRTKPGLQPQHVMAVKAAAELCDARVKGDAVGSVQFEFRPGAEIRGRDYEFDIGTAGASGLVFQTVFLPLTAAGVDSRFTIRGGTHVPHAPPIDYLSGVYLTALRQAGVEARLSYGPAGFYPQGGGVVLSSAGKGSLTPVSLTERGGLRNLTAHIVTARLPEHVAERGATTVETFMKGVGRKVITVRHDSGELARSTGAAVVLTAECDGGFAGFTGLGERGKPMEKVAEQACEEFMKWWKTGAAVDEHLSDQLVLPMSLTTGESRWTTPAVTDHLRTVLWVVEKFLPIQHRIDEPDGSPAVVTLTGAGWKR